MKIGIFSKLGASGGSEHRCVEMCNGIQRYTSHTPILFCEEGLSQKIIVRLDPDIEVVKNVFKPEPQNHERLYDVDSLLIVNSDSGSFAKLDYWEGKLEKHHNAIIDVSRIPQMVFLFNFVISPAKNLTSIASKCKDVRIVCANKSYNQEINEDNARFSDIRHLPRFILESPINPELIALPKTESEVIRIGKHSKSFGYKFDASHRDLIEYINDRYPGKVAWDFLGVPEERIRDLGHIPNVVCRQEYSVDVGEYLRGIDIFLFLIDWNRSEPWSRAVAEGIMSGCPVLATNKGGNIDQVTHGNNGFLCKDIGYFKKYLMKLIEQPELRSAMGHNSKIFSRTFRSDKIVNDYVNFISA